jgi:hypothetical protein
MHETLLPAGKYFVGDPVLAMPEDDWKSFLRDFEEPENVSDVSIQGFKAFVGCTRGDGLFEASRASRASKGGAHLFSVEVTTGLLAVVPVEAIPVDIMAGLAGKDGVRFEDFREPFVCKWRGIPARLLKLQDQPWLTVEDLDRQGGFNHFNEIWIGSDIYIKGH